MKKLKFTLPFLYFLISLLISVIRPSSVQAGYCECTTPRKSSSDWDSAEECEIWCRPSDYTYSNGECECWSKTLYFEAGTEWDCNNQCQKNCGSNCSTYFMSSPPSCEVQCEGCFCQDITTRHGGREGCIGGHQFCFGQPNNYECCPPPKPTPSPPASTKEGIAKFIGLPKAESIPQLIGFSLRVVLGIMGVVAFLMFVFGGITWLTSAGNPDKIKKAKDILVWATIGLIVIFASYTLVDLVIKTVTK